MPGPVPKRSSERRRRNLEGRPDKVTATGTVEAPPADPTWHKIAADWYVALGKSAQSQFYEPSDWATAAYVADAMSRNLKAGRFSAQLFAATMAAMTNLLVTEGDRRRARLEIERATGAQVASVSPLDAYRDLTGS